MNFVKMHGIGNDYVYVDAIAEPAVAARGDLADLARRISDRQRGVGSDGLILVCEPTAAGAHVRMRMFNADGSESEMCGNGVRCVAKFAVDRLGFTAQPLLVETGRGVLPISYTLRGGWVETATVDMGEPLLEAGEIPTTLGTGRVIDAALPADLHAALAAHGCLTAAGGGVAARATCVSMGNPHAVLFCDDPGAVTLERIGPVFERSPAFPRRVNLHVVSTESKTRATMRTWERGAGLTQACGTGACAVLVAGVLTGKLGRAADISLPGGDLHIRWNDSAAGGRVLMTGPATEICEGQWPDEPARPARGEFPALRTERLLLRELTQADAPALRRHLLPKEVTDGMSSAQHPLPEGDEVRRIGRFRRIFNSGDGAIWGMVLPESGELVGVIGLNVDRKTERAMLGYTVSVPHWGKGFATEAGKSVIDHAFGSVGVAVVWAGRFGWNEASGRVLEKLGMTFDGAQRAFLKKNEVWQEDRLYSILRSEWEKSR